MSAKKSFKKQVSPAEALEAKKAEVEALRFQCLAVEKMLGISTEQSRRIRAEVQSLSRDIALKDQMIEDVDKTLTNDLKTMKSISTLSAEQLAQREETLQRAVTDSIAENDAMRTKMATVFESREAELRKWEDDVDAQQHYIDQKALLFGMQLKETLARVQHRSA